MDKMVQLALMALQVNRERKEFAVQLDIQVRMGKGDLKENRVLKVELVYKVILD